MSKRRSIGPSFIKILLLGGAALLAVSTAIATASPQADFSHGKNDLVVVAVGDIACSPHDANFADGAGKDGKCQQAAVIDAINREPRVDVLILLGDIQYNSGRYDDFMKSFTPAWRSVKAKSVMAIPGNHDYGEGNIRSFREAMPQTFGFRYVNFGERSYGSLQKKGWLLVGLDSECEIIGGCNPDSPQMTWFDSTLADHRSDCTLAFWHYPLFSSGRNGVENMLPAWSIAERSGADIILNGHDHLYERFAPQSVYGDPNSPGVREFIAGTGGADLHDFVRPFSTAHENGQNQYGYLKMVLKKGGYDWQYISTDGLALDSGLDSCHGAPANAADLQPLSISPNRVQTYTSEPPEGGTEE